MKNHLSRFEELARRLIEGSFSRLWPGALSSVELATHLAQAIEQHAVGRQMPDMYEVFLNPADYTAVLSETPTLAYDLTRYVQELGQQAGLSLWQPPRLSIQPDARLSARQVRVNAAHRVDEEQATQLHERVVVTAVDEVRAALSQIDAFLIVEGRRHVPLAQPITTLGRRTDNDVVLDSSAVSRRQAQIRWRYGRFVLYDLSGRGRTAVNGQPITECALHPGDVISLSDVTIIYGEGQSDRQRQSAATAGLEDTLLYPPVS